MTELGAGGTSLCAGSGRTSRGDQSRRRQAARDSRLSCRGAVDLARSTGPDSRTRHREILVSVIEAEAHVGIGILVGARELDQRARGAVAASCDLDLDARHEVLRLVVKRLVDA